MAADDVDVIGDELGPADGPRWSRPRAALPAGARTVALSTAVSLVLAGGVATAAYRGSQGGVEPTSMIPASAFGVAVVDLGLPGGQGDALRAFADHFPGSPTHDGDGSTVDRLLRPVLHGIDARIDYDRDVAPWLGEHAAIAGWLDGDGKPRLEVLLESTNDGSAREHLDRLIDHTDAGLVFSDGYAVLSDTAAHATAAVTAAHRRSLADAGSMARDVAGLPGDDAMLSWLDGPATERALRSALGGMLPPGGMGGLLGGGLFGMAGMTGAAAGGRDSLQARVAAGVHLTDDYAQLDVVQYGGQSAPTAPSSLLAKLPTDTVGAVEVAGPGRMVAQVATVLRSLGDFGGVTSECGSGTAVPSPVPQLQPRQPARLLVPPGVPHRKRLLRELRHARRQAVVGMAHPPTGKFHPGTGGSDGSGNSSGGSSGSCTVIAPPSPLDAFRQATGLSLPGDVQTLLGDAAVVSYGGLQIGSLPDVAVRSQPADVAAARPVADRLASHLADAHLAQLGIAETGGDLVLATSQTYAEKVATAGDLAAQDRARTALGTLPDRVTTAGYVDLTRVWPLLGSDVPSDVGHIAAVGFWGDVTGSRQHFQLRLVAR